MYILKYDIQLLSLNPKFAKRMKLMVMLNSDIDRKIAISHSRVATQPSNPRAPHPSTHGRDNDMRQDDGKN